MLELHITHLDTASGRKSSPTSSPSASRCGPPVTKPSPTTAEPATADALGLCSA